MSLYEKEIVGWFKNNQRDLPWRKSNAWGVLVSEIMLQQTPVARVLPIYNEWMKRWPSPRDLAAANTAEIITAWGRLGYPRRALRLHQCAKAISEQYNNRLPETEQERSERLSAETANAYRAKHLTAWLEQLYATGGGSEQV